jgi:hypothetical protein
VEEEDLSLLCKDSQEEVEVLEEQCLVFKV